jgi:hypothetical protein
MIKGLSALLLCVYMGTLLDDTDAFATFLSRITRKTLSLDAESSQSSRRNFFEQSVSSVSAAILANVVGIPPQTASAAVSGANKVNAKLKGFGLPVMASIPDGFSPLLEIYGKGKNRFPLLVTFAHPLSWVVTTPSNNVNGEDGTVQAGDYGKGDTATFFVYEQPGHVDDITTQPKSLYEETLQKAIGQRGANMFQNFKITKAEPFIASDGQKYVLVDFKYQLLTGAGFEVDRKGVASITSEGAAVEALWAASTAPRFKKTEQSLRDIVSTFRCYAEGINFSNDLVVYDT